MEDVSEVAGLGVVKEGVGGGGGGACSFDVVEEGGLLGSVENEKRRHIWRVGTKFKE